jgi:hypothetical protein
MPFIQMYSLRMDAAESRKVKAPLGPLSTTAVELSALFSLSHSTPPLAPLALLSDVVNFIHMEWSRPVPSPIKLPWGCNLRMIVLS